MTASVELQELPAVVVDQAPATNTPSKIPWARTPEGKAWRAVWQRQYRQKDPEARRAYDRARYARTTFRVQLSPEDRARVIAAADACGLSLHEWLGQVVEAYLATLTCQHRIERLEDPALEGPENPYETEALLDQDDRLCPRCHGPQQRDRRGAFYCAPCLAPGARKGNRERKARQPDAEVSV